MNYKSPFLVARDLVSPLQCEDMVERLKHTLPNTDQKGDPTVTYKGNRLSEMRTLPLFEELLPNVEKHYGFEAKAWSKFVFEWYPTGFSGSKATSEAYKLNKKGGKNSGWQKINDYDFTVIIFLNDYNDELSTFDPNFEVYGGKLEFPTHDFGFNPQRGTSVIFPSRPNFINAIAPVQLGDLNLVRFHIIADKEYHYDPEQFKGGYTEWFGT